MKRFKVRVLDDLTGTTLCVTGASGYVGTHLIKALTTAGHRPFVIGRPGVTLDAHPGTDVADPWATSADLATQLAQFDKVVVLNLAGHFISQHGTDDVLNLVAGNMGYPTLIYDALAASGHRCIVNVGTSWEYSDNGSDAPINLYAALKSANTVVLDWYATRFGLQVMNLKLNDTYGGQDPRQKLMPLLKKHAQHGTQMQLGYEDQLINLLYIDDVIEGVLHSANITQHVLQGTADTGFLLAEETQTIADVVAILQTDIVPTLQVTFKGTAPKDAPLRKVWDTAPRPTGWAPRVALRTGLANYFTLTP